MGEGAGLIVPVSDSTIRSVDQLFLIRDEYLLAPAIQKLGE
jgi:hypothetical protein